MQTFNVRMFLSLVQADGFNPLTVATSNFKIPVEKMKELIEIELKVTDPTQVTLSTPE